MDHNFLNWAAAFLFAEYQRAWRKLGSGSKVAAALGLDPGEHFELAAWQGDGARRIIVRRLAVSP